MITFNNVRSHAHFRVINHCKNCKHMTIIPNYLALDAPQKLQLCLCEIVTLPNCPGRLLGRQIVPYRLTIFIQRKALFAPRMNQNIGITGTIAFSRDDSCQGWGS